MLYHAGDTVFVRNDLKNGPAYYDDAHTDYYFTCDGMLLLRGHPVTIANVYSYFYTIEEDGQDYYWTDEMFSGLAEHFAEVSVDVSAFL